ncbi:alpha-L-rhamnosidase C-terminal domain-containing protein [Streptomyces sp. enrichment culture]|uniref:alpha-L-rhamnosidase C-terminal domain-containing protein n=1 Tax=Streptomyces sp. enrichment culture TaxID=1795815 RepID=UPI003F567B9E
MAGPHPGDAGYRTFLVRPDARTGVDRARTSIRAVRGQAAVSWSRIDRRLRPTVCVQPTGRRGSALRPRQGPRERRARRARCGQGTTRHDVETVAPSGSGGAAPRSRAVH